jgi:hypothetical protein
MLVGRKQMTVRASIVALTFTVLTGCTINHPYPKSWAPIPAPTTEDCHHLEGDYNDRGDYFGLSDPANGPSLTYKLFGDDSHWGSATRVSLALPRSDALTVTVWHGSTQLFARTLSSEEGDFRCEAGHLIVRDHRWFGGTMVEGFEKLTITLSATDDYLVAEDKRFSTALAMIILPVIVTETNWYRFPRLRDRERSEVTFLRSASKV